MQYFGFDDAVVVCGYMCVTTPFVWHRQRPRLWLPPPTPAFLPPYTRPIHCHTKADVLATNWINENWPRIGREGRVSRRSLNPWQPRHYMRSYILKDNCFANDKYACNFFSLHHRTAKLRLALERAVLQCYKKFRSAESDSACDVINLTFSHFLLPAPPHSNCRHLEGWPLPSVNQT